MNKPTIFTNIPDEAWEKTGPEDNPDARLYADLEINRVPFHCEAFLTVTDTDDGEQYLANPEWNNYADRAINALNDQKLHTVAIAGREYIVIAYPHGV